MPNLTAGYPKLTGYVQVDIKHLYEAHIALIDELKTLLCNLDGGNVIEAERVSAQNIDTTKAKIKNAQIASLTADKLTAGTIDTGEITIGNEDDRGSVTIAKQLISFIEGSRLRMAMGRGDDGEYVFSITSKDGKSGIYMDENGDIAISGSLKIRANALANESSVDFVDSSGAAVARIVAGDNGNVHIFPTTSGGGIYAGIYEIATQKDIDELKELING